MSETAAMFCKRSCTALVVVNALLLLALCRRLHAVILNQTDSIAMESSPPSIVIVLMAVLGVAILLGFRWLRPPWLIFVVQLTLLTTGCLLLLKLQVFPL